MEKERKKMWQINKEHKENKEEAKNENKEIIK